MLRKYKHTYTHKQSLLSRIRHHTKQLLVPHHKNQYQPYLIRTVGMMVVLGAVVGMQLWSGLAGRGSVLGLESNITTEQLVELTNAERAAQGLEPLTLDARLNGAATMKAKDMFTRQYWAHEAPDGTKPWAWIKQNNYSYQLAGENLAKDFHTSAGVVTAWMNSAEHRQNILEPDYKNVGFAVVPGVLDGKETSLVVAYYGAPQSGAAATAQPAVLAATDDAALSPVARFGIALQSMTPALLGSIVVLFGAAAVALTAHQYRSKLPKSLRQDWRRHHGLYKALGMVSLVIIVIALYSGGQI